LKLTLILLTLCVLFASALPCMAQSGQPKTGAIPPTIDDERETTWKEFSSPEGRFSILFPGMPQIQSRQVPTPDGKAVSLVIHTLRTFAEYGVIYADYPFEVVGPDMARRVLDAGVKGAVAEVQSELTSVREISLEGHPGRALREKMPRGEIMHARMYLVGSRLYQIAITLPKEDGLPDSALKAREETASKFLDSFKLLPVGTPLEAKPMPGDPEGPSATAVTEGEVDRLLKQAKKWDELVIGVCLEGADCEPLKGQVVDGHVIQGQLTVGKVVRKQGAEYPPLAKMARARGTVAVQVIVDGKGKVSAAQAVSGHPLLRAAAVKAARDWEFTPSLLDGRPVKVTGRISVNFVLQ